MKGDGEVATGVTFWQVFGRVKNRRIGDRVDPVGMILALGREFLHREQPDGGFHIVEPGRKDTENGKSARRNIGYLDENANAAVVAMNRWTKGKRMSCSSESESRKS